MSQSGQHRPNSGASATSVVASATTHCSEANVEDANASVPHAREQLDRVLASVPIEEAQGLLVELGRALVNGSMCAGREHEKLATIDTLGQRVGEAQRGDLVVATEGDLGRCFDMGQLGNSIVVNHRV